MTSVSNRSKLMLKLALERTTTGNESTSNNKPRNVNGEAEIKPVQEEVMLNIGQNIILATYETAAATLVPELPTTNKEILSGVSIESIANNNDFLVLPDPADWLFTQNVQEEQIINIERAADEDEKAEDPDYVPDYDNESDFENNVDESSSGFPNDRSNIHTIAAVNQNQIQEPEVVGDLIIPKKKRRRLTCEQMEHNTMKHPMLPTCSCSKLNCNANFTNAERQQIHDEFWSIEKQKQRIWLSEHVKEITVKRKVQDSKRNYTRIFYLRSANKEEDIRVCQKFFLSTLGFKFESVLQSMLRAMKDSNGHRRVIPEQDKRGTSEPTNKKARVPIIDHINSFKPLPSHYRRYHAPYRKYLPPDLTVKIMHTDYCENNPSNKVSYELYRRVIDEQNIGFYETIQDKCSNCLEFDLNLDLNDRERLKAEHMEKVNSARQEYKKDQEVTSTNNEFAAFAVDLQKVVLLPRMPHVKQSFFLSRLVTFNETFAAMNKMGRHTCVIWHEAIAGRDAGDVTCAFLKFFEIHRDIKKIVLWMDNCTGQNKNWVFYSNIICYLNQESCCTEEITLKYLVPGHTFMAADGLHGKIEQGMRKMNKVQDFSDFLDICKKSSNRMDILPLQITDFMNLENKIKSRNYTANAKDPLPLFRDIVEAKFKKGSKDFYYKSSFNDDDYTKTNNILKKKVKMVFPNRKQEPRGVIEEKKVKIINELVGKMDANRKEFWLALPTNVQSEDLLKSGF